MRFGSLPSEHSRRADMEVLLLFVALLQESALSTLYGPRFLTGAVGGSVTHQCFYSITPANKHDRKFWCKRKRDGICYTIISTTNFISEDYMGRVALEDVPQNGTFMVTMTQLKTSDTGIYRCGIGPTNSDLYVSLNLTVSADGGTQRPVELFLGELRGSVTIPCPPGDSQSGIRRLWCRVGKSSCILIADTDGYVGKSYEGRIYITPQESSGAFKVLINDLRPEDMGLYRCGMGSPVDWDRWQMVALQVTTVPAQPRRVKFLHGRVGGSLTLRCHHDPAGSYTSKYLCRWQKASCSLLVDTDGFVHESYKGRLWISSSMQDSGTYTVMMSHLQEEDAGWYWCGARNRHREHTTSMKLHIEKETFTSQNPARHNSVNPTLPLRSPSNRVVAQRSTTWPTYTTGPTDTTGPTYTMGPTDTTGPTYTMGPTDTTGPTYTTGPTDTTGPTYTMGPTDTTRLTYAMGPTDTTWPTYTTGLRLTTKLAYITGTRTEGTSPHPPVLPPSTFVTSRSDTYSQSSSGEFSLLSVVIPALVLLIFIITTVLVLTKIKLCKEMGEERSTLGQTEAVLVRTGLSPTEGQGMEELSSPDNTNGCKAESGRHRNPSVKNIPSNMNDEDLREPGENPFSQNTMYISSEASLLKGKTQL